MATGEEVLDLVIPYVHDTEDRNSLSLVSRKFYEIDGLTRKRLTVHVLYYPNPASLSKRFPFVESLTLKGTPSSFNFTDHSGIRLTPWIEHLGLEFRCLKELCIHGLVVQNKDLEKLGRTRGKDLTSLKIKKCRGFSTDGLMHVANFCNQLRTLCLKYCDDNVTETEGIWLHQLALNSTILERLHVTNICDVFDAEDLTLLAKNCSNSLISLKIGGCYLSELEDAFRYAVRLKHFGGDIWGDESDILEVLDIESHGDYTLQVIGEFCKNLRKLTHNGLATRKGLIALAKGCTKLECLKVTLKDISNEAINYLGTHLKNLRKFRMKLIKKDGTTDLPLDNGIRAMLTGCRKLETLDLHFHMRGGLTDLGLEYIGEYGANLRSLSLTLVGNSNAGLVKLSEGCPRLRKLNLQDCPSSKQAVASSVFNIHSLRYVSGCCGPFDLMALTRPGFQL